MAHTGYMEFYEREMENKNTVIQKKTTDVMPIR